MTQDIILVVLLIGIIGLVWALTIEILHGDDRRAHNTNQNLDVHHPSNPEASDKTPLSHRTAA